MSRARRLAGLVAVGLLTAAGLTAGPASAFWTGFDTPLHGTGAAASGSLHQGATPTAVSAGTDVHVSWGVSTLSNGQPAAGYVVTRYDPDSADPQTMRSDCTGTIATTSCVEKNVPAGDWTYTVTPITGDHWRGAESSPSGAVRTGTIVLTLDRSVIGPPLPTQLGATLTGFGADDALDFTLDGVPIAGSPARSDAAGNATISGLTIPADIGDGPHEIAVADDDQDDDAAQASFLVDTTAPTITAEITPAANAAGWNDSVPVTFNGVVDDGTGSGFAYVQYTDDGTDPTTSPTAQRVLVAPTATQTTTYRFIAVDRAGNASAAQTLNVRIDTTPPPFTLAFVDVHGGAYIGPASPDGAPGTPYYRGSEAGSVRFQVTPVAPSGSPIASAGFTPLSADTTGMSFDSSSITSPAGGPYVSNPFSWTAGTTSIPSGTISLTDAAGNSAGDRGLFYNDSTAPSGGSVDAIGLVGTGGRYSTSTTVNVALAPGADAGSGLADGSAATDLPRQLLRASAPLTSSNGVADSTCGAYGAYAPVGGDDPASPVADTVPDDVTCYRYRYLVPDHVGNVATYESPDVKVMTAAGDAVLPTTATITPVSGTDAQAVVGSTAYYNPAQAGSFHVDSSATSPAVGIARVTFPGIDGFTGGGSETTPVSSATYRTTYAWSANAASPSPGAQAISATDNAGTTRTNATAFTLIADATAPSGGSANATGLGGTGGRYSTSTALSVVLTAGSDGGAGLAAGGRQLWRASAALTSDGTADGVCGTYGADVQVGADNPTSPKSDTVPQDRACYRYRYTVSDAVGNPAEYTSPDVKVDAGAPPAPTLTFSNLVNVTTIGGAIFYRPAASSGAFTVTAASADPTSGTASYGFPTLPGGWSSSSTGPGVRTYTWSAPNPTAPAATQSVTTTNHAAGQSTTTFAIAATTDSTPPSGGSVSYANGYSTNAAVNVSFTKGTDGGSGLAAASGILQRSGATLAAGACGAFDAFATVASNPTSAYSNPVTSGCYQYRYLISDAVGNVATYTTPSVVKVDQVAPTNTVSIINATGAYSAFGGATLYYKGDAPGSFTYVNAVADGQSGPASSDFFDPATTGWTHAAQTVSIPAGGPFTSTPYRWTANPGTPPLASLVGRDAAGKVWSAAVSFANDVTPPSASTITYANGLVSVAAVPVNVLNGTDSGSGTDPATAVLHRDEAPLTTATETCGTFPGTYATAVALVGGSDTGVASGRCYRYSTTLADRVGNVTTTTSANVVKVDTSGPQVTAIASQQSGGTAGNGLLQVGDRLVLTFNQSLANATVPTSFTGATESSAGTGATVALTIPGITNGPVSTGGTAYVSAGTTASFGGTISLANSGATTTVTVAVTTVSGATPHPDHGTLALTPAASIHDVAGLSAVGTFSTAIGFQLF